MAKKKARKSMGFGVQDERATREGDWSALDHGRDLGANAMRSIVSMDKVMRDGKFDWSTWDKIVDESRQRGLRPQLVLDAPQDTSLKEYKKYISRAVRHFGDKVDRYSFMNEPNWHHMNPKRYRNFYKAGREAVRKHDPGASVLLGELAPSDAVTYLKRVLKHGNLRAEGVAVHPYQFNGDPLGPGEAQGSLGNLARVNRQLEDMNVETRMGRTPGIFATEFGYHTRGDRATTDQQAAVWWKRAMKQARKTGVRQMIAYHMNEEPANREWDSSLVRTDGSPRPAYEALRAILARSR